MKITKSATEITRSFGSSTTYNNSGGLAPAGTDTMQEAIDAILGGSGPFLRNTLGGLDIVQALGTLGATETIDLANGSVFWGTMDQNVTIGTTGWTSLRGASIRVELIQDGTGGWTPTFSGVTWIGGTPTWVTTAGTVTHVVLISRDGGTTIYGVVVGAGGSSLSFATPAIVLGTAAAAGAASTVIRSDSTIVAFDATVPANVTATAATGSAAVAARRDHVHALADTAGHYELLMAGGITSPPEPLENGDGSDWLYVWVPG